MVKGRNTTQLGLRLRDEVIEYIRPFAEKKGMSVCTYIREWVESAVEKKLKESKDV